ncbi:hypothetical protein QFC19_002538 [Naganishia cerealis]|uniref:Uncharacterized protein n=1 Tax=Naganishia cerealis TaxID=610337 RepID=A0ACC2W9F5_9TREE|nr:hypothetical protein QFC19_002538 [Naganishia cerealis]
MSTFSDPVNPLPGLPLIHSYSYHSALPLEDVMMERDDGQTVKETWIMGIDEAGRGRPMVYAAAYCPKSFQGELEELGFDASIIAKVTRDRIIESWIHPESPRLTMCLKAVPMEMVVAKGKGKKKVAGKNGKGKDAKRTASSNVLDMDDEEAKSQEAQEPARKRQRLQEFDSETLTESESFDALTPSEKDGDELHVRMVEERGSGYPSGKQSF